jgi:nucleoside-diphosphate-sugar epimerase
VTGASGFIGSNVCRDLLAHGHAVTALVRPASNCRFLSGLSALAIVHGDILDTASLHRVMRGVDVVVHTAGHASDWGAWDTFRALNVRGVGNVVAAARANAVRRIVHLSSVSVYGFPGGTDLDETTPFLARPRDRYIATKAAGEREALASNGRGIEVVVIRPGSVYGPNDQTTTLRLAPLLQAGRFPHVNGGRALMAPTYVDNLTSMIRCAADRPGIAGHAFNAADDGRTTWHQFIEWLCADLSCRPPRLSLPGAALWPVAHCLEALGRAARLRASPPLNTYRLRTVVRDSHYSTDKAKYMLDWQPKVDTREGIRRTAAWYLRAATRSPRAAALAVSA